MKKVLFNDNWLFSSDIKADPVIVQLPHDAMQTESRVPGLPNGSSTGYYPGGIYTYTKSFDVTEENLHQTNILEFEGVYMNSSVYLNGSKVGGHLYGYTDFLVDLTDKLRLGENELKVIADNSQTPNSRWYSGSGIYRDVTLHTAGKEYIKIDGIKVKTVSIQPAQIEVTVNVKKSPATKLNVRILKDGILIAENEGEKTSFEIANAKLWHADSPELYEVEALLLDEDNNVLDQSVDTFGIRMITWDHTPYLAVHPVNHAGEKCFIGQACLKWYRRQMM